MSSLDVFCSKTTSEVVTLNAGDKFLFKTQPGDWYKKNTRCTVSYTRGHTCPSIQFSCSQFDVFNKKSNCLKGDTMIVTADGEESR